MVEAMIDKLELVVLTTLNTESMILAWIAGQEENEELSNKFFEMVEENRKIIKKERERIDGLY